MPNSDVNKLISSCPLVCVELFTQHWCCLLRSRSSFPFFPLIAFFFSSLPHHLSEQVRCALDCRRRPRGHCAAATHRLGRHRRPPRTPAGHSELDGAACLSDDSVLDRRGWEPCDGSERDGSERDGSERDDGSRGCEPCNGSERDGGGGRRGGAIVGRVSAAFV
jgi:hypothetical protein